MTLLFWLLLLPAVLTFALIAWATDRACQAIHLVYQRWACRRESARAEREIISALLASHALISDIQTTLEAEVLMIRRRQLEGLATAQDKRERRIH